MEEETTRAIQNFCVASRELREKAEILRRETSEYNQRRDACKRLIREGMDQTGDDRLGVLIEGVLHELKISNINSRAL